MTINLFIPMLLNLYTFVQIDSMRLGDKFAWSYAAPKLTPIRKYLVVWVVTVWCNWFNNKVCYCIQVSATCTCQ